MKIPYEGATSGVRAREEIKYLLEKFGCDSVGFMDEFSSKSLLLAFVWRGRSVQLRASAQGWANMYLKANPWRPRRRGTRHDYEAKALQQGMVAINSILRDWVKGQVTAVETGMLTFEHVFLPHMLAHDGRPLLEHLETNKMLPRLQHQEEA